VPDKYDVVIVGGGHNGLTTAAYLARAGRRVLVLEKKASLGGAAVTEDFYPGFSASSVADEFDTLSPKVVAGLNLKQCGLQVLPVDPLVFAPQEDGRHLTIWHDVMRTSKEIAQFSQADAHAYPVFIKAMDKLARVVSALNHMILPDMPDAGFIDLAEAFKLFKPIRSLGWKNVTQVMRSVPMPVADLISEWFESEAVKAAIAASALNHLSLGPQESGTGYAFLQNFSHSKNGLFRAGGQIKGGAGALTAALANAARKAGVMVQTNADVCEITVKHGRATGVVLADGKAIIAGRVVSALDMRTTYLGLVDAGLLGGAVLKQVRNITYGGTTARVHYALDALPEFKGLNSQSPQELRGHIQLAPTMTYLQKAFDPVKYGEFSEHPYLDMRIPTLNDPSLAPEGKHVLSATVKYIPFHLREGNWEALHAALGELVTRTISAWAPGFELCVQHCHVITPLDMQTDYYLPEGSLTHGDITLDQSLWMRPIPGFAQYQSPIKGLYHCSTATNPGAGITGINGMNAARRMLRGKK
jgi:phytoene dehydrogenase-like protein